MEVLIEVPGSQRNQKALQEARPAGLGIAHSQSFLPVLLPASTCPLLCDIIPQNHLFDGSFSNASPEQPHHSSRMSSAHLSHFFVSKEYTKEQVRICSFKIKEVIVVFPSKS